MAQTRVGRRLAAILAADVAGYSLLMSTDEAGTLSALQAHRSELIGPAVKRHRGRIVKLMGDSILAEFGSVVEAVKCADEIQREMEIRNRGTRDDHRMLLRIGVHLGDVIIDGSDIYGDGVNIAARLEGIAEPGRICISRQAYDQVEGKLPLTCRPLGPQKLKNIPKPVEVYAIDPDWGGGRVENFTSSARQAGAGPVSTGRPRPDGIEGRLLSCVRRRAPRLCDRWQRATAGEDGELDESRRI